MIFISSNVVPYYPKNERYFWGLRKGVDPGYSMTEAGSLSDFLTWPVPISLQLTTTRYHSNFPLAPRTAMNGMGLGEC